MVCNLVYMRLAAGLPSHAVNYTKTQRLLGSCSDAVPHRSNYNANMLPISQFSYFAVSRSAVVLLNHNIQITCLSFFPLAFPYHLALVCFFCIRAIGFPSFLNMPDAFLFVYGNSAIRGRVYDTRICFGIAITDVIHIFHTVIFL